MNAGARLGLYGAGLVVVFGAVFAASGALAPQGAAQAWGAKASAGQEHGNHVDQGAAAPDAAADATASAAGTTLAANGYTLGSISAPATAGQKGELRFALNGADGKAATGLEEAHQKQLHLIVVRSDGAHFRHVHPVFDAASGTWGLPWSWDAAGSYRVYTDFVGQGGEATTLSRTVDVAGELTPAASVPAAQPGAAGGREASVDGYTVRLDGELSAGAPSTLKVQITDASGAAVERQPYLGAFGHLVTLRQGDLAFLHSHPEGKEASQGSVSRDPLGFAVTAPTAGRYFLYVDFQVNGTVHSAAFQVDASEVANAPSGGSETPQLEPSATEPSATEPAHSGDHAPSGTENNASPTPAHSGH